MMIGTVLSELHLSHEYLLKLNFPKLQILYSEALRQRVNKAFMLMELLGVHRIEHKNDRKKVIDGYNNLTKPFKVMHDVVINKHEVDTSWEILRGKAR